MNHKLSASALMLLLSAGPCIAALGAAPTAHSAVEGTTTPVAHSLNALQSPARFTEVQTVLASGTTLIEYVDANDCVFGVSWAGPFQPDLSALLDSFYPAFVAEATAHSGTARTMLNLNHSDIVISAMGHMRSYQGRAWLPASLPAGVAPADIK